jgi:hypothetical protein
MLRGQRVCGDFTSRLNVLQSYARISLELGGDWTFLLYPGSSVSCSYVYLGYMKVIEGVGVGPEDNIHPWNMSKPGNLVHGINRFH